MARLEVGAPLGVTVLQEVFVATLPKFHLADLIALLAEHNVFFGVTLRGAFGSVESREDFAAIADLPIGGSFESSGHRAKVTGFRCGVQVFS